MEIRADNTGESIVVKNMKNLTICDDSLYGSDQKLAELENKIDNIAETLINMQSKIQEMSETQQAVALFTNETNSLAHKADTSINGLADGQNFITLALQDMDADITNIYNETDTDNDEEFDKAVRDIAKYVNHEHDDDDQMEEED